MIIDDHKGYYPCVMKYDWITALGYAGNGRLVGFNLNRQSGAGPREIQRELPVAGW
jgi:hypothetical protein